VPAEIVAEALMDRPADLVGRRATPLPSRIVGESLEDDERRNRTVERFIATLESQDPATTRGAG